MPLFDRVYRLVIGTPGGTVGTAEYAKTRQHAVQLLEQAKNPNLTDAQRTALADEIDRTKISLANQAKGVSRGSGVEITELRVSFVIQKTLSKNPNKNSIKVWNLSPKTRAELEKPDVRCQLYAGYSEQNGPVLIFQGNVTFAYTYYEGPDVITEFELGDGEAEYRNSTVSLGYAAGASSKRIMGDIAAQMGLSLYVASDVQDFTYPQGFSYYGAARNALTRVTRAAGLQWSIQNGLVQVVQSGGGTSRRAIVLAADSGMIGYPERERQSSAETAKVKDATTGQARNIVSAARQFNGWRVKSLLMPSILAGDQVKLESKSVNEVFIASEVSHVGDSHEGDWQTTLKLVDAATAAAIQQKEAKRAADEAKRGSS